MKFLLRITPIYRVLFLVLLVFSAPATAGEVASFYTQNGQKIVLEIDIADTPETLQKGLMHRQELGEAYGMLFLFDAPIHAIMWMKDTPLSLDMFFIDTNGIIQFIEENTTPYSEALITSPVKVSAVLEMKAGSAERLNLVVGDRLVTDKLK